MTDEYSGPERRKQVHITDDQVDQIAERAAAKAVEKMTREAYQAIGKGVVRKALWIIGMISVAGYVWATQNGFLKPPHP